MKYVKRMEFTFIEQDGVVCEFFMKNKTRNIFTLFRDGKIVFNKENTNKKVYTEMKHFINVNINEIMEKLENNVGLNTYLMREKK